MSPDRNRGARITRPTRRERKRCAKLVDKAIRKQVRKVHDVYGGIDQGGCVVELLILADKIRKEG